MERFRDSLHDQAKGTEESEVTKRLWMFAVSGLSPAVLVSLAS